MTRTEYDKTVAAMRVSAELKVKDLESVVKCNSDLRRYLFMLEYNEINYKLFSYSRWVEIHTEYARIFFNLDGEQITIKKALNYEKKLKKGIKIMKTIRRWWVAWYVETPWYTDDLGDDRYFDNEDEAKAFCEQMLKDKDISKVRIEEHLTYIKEKKERN